MAGEDRRRRRRARAGGEERVATGGGVYPRERQKHLSFLRQLTEARKLRLAGPFLDEGKLFGLALVAAKSLDEATAWMSEDPATPAGMFAYEIHPALLPSLEALRVQF